VKFKERSCYQVEFLDHSVGIDTPVNCKAVGYVLKETKDYILLSNWLVITDDIALFEANLEKVVILKACITNKRLMK
jgi:hypothetical protein